MIFHVRLLSAGGTDQVLLASLCRELGYKAHVSRAQGLQEMREEYTQQQQASKT